MLNRFTLTELLVDLFALAPRVAWACWRLIRALTSRGSSFVVYRGHVTAANCLNAWHSALATVSSIPKVVSVWRRSFAYACQVASRNRSSLMLLLSSSRNKPSKAGIEHSRSINTMCLSGHGMNHIPVEYLRNLRPPVG